MTGIGGEIGTHLFKFAKLGQIGKAENKVSVAGCCGQACGQHIKMTVRVAGQNELGMFHGFAFVGDIIKRVQKDRITDKTREIAPGFKIVKQSPCSLIEPGDNPVPVDHHHRIGQVIKDFGIGAGLGFQM